MTYGTIDGVRVLTGLTPDDISDDDLSALIAVAERWFFGEVFIRVEREDITDRAKTKTIYRLTHTPVVSLVNGFTPQPGDVKVVGVNLNALALSDFQRDINVIELNADLGLIELESAPVPGERLLATYYYAPVRITDEDITTAVNLLASHLATLRVEAPGTLTIQDLDKNALVVKNTETRFWDAYVQKRNAILGKARFRRVVK